MDPAEEYVPLQVELILFHMPVAFTSWTSGPPSINSAAAVRSDMSWRINKDFVSGWQL